MPNEFFQFCKVGVNPFSYVYSVEVTRRIRKKTIKSEQYLANIINQLQRFARLWGLIEKRLSLTAWKEISQRTDDLIEDILSVIYTGFFG